MTWKAKLNPWINWIYLQKCSVILHKHQTMAISKAMGHIKLVTWYNSTATQNSWWRDSQL